MGVKYYKDADSLYIDLSEKPSIDSQEIAGGVVLDYDSTGNLVDIDIDRVSIKVDLSMLIVGSMPGAVAIEN